MLVSLEEVDQEEKQELLNQHSIHIKVVMMNMDFQLMKMLDPLENSEKQVFQE